MEFSDISDDDMPSSAQVPRSPASTTSSASKSDSDFGFDFGDLGSEVDGETSSADLNNDSTEVEVSFGHEKKKFQ